MPALKPKEVAKLLGVSERTVYNWIDVGYLPAYKVGGAIRISYADLQRFLEKSKTIDEPYPMRRIRKSRLKEIL